MLFFRSNDPPEIRGILNFQNFCKLLVLLTIFLTLKNLLFLALYCFEDGFCVTTQLRLELNSAHKLAIDTNPERDKVLNGLQKLPIVRCLLLPYIWFLTEHLWPDLLPKMRCKGIKAQHKVTERKQVYIVCLLVRLHAEAQLVCQFHQPSKADMELSCCRDCCLIIFQQL